jgi:hypothetical protein
VVTILALAHGPDKLRRLCRRHGSLEEGADPDTVELLQRLHEICHQGGDLAREVGKDLDERFRSTMLQVRSLEIEKIERLEMKWPVPLLWATLRDVRENVRSYGRRMLHELLWRALRQTFVQREEGRDLGEETRLLREQNIGQRSEIEALRKELEKKNAEIWRHEKTSIYVESERKSAERAEIGEGRLKREIRKLRHELDKEREKVRRLTEKAAPSVASLAESAIHDPFSSTGSQHAKTCPCSGESGVSSCRGECAREDGFCKECPLEGLRVAVVGGIGRMQPVYREVVQQLGAEPLFHDGQVGNGSYKLKNVVCGADIVVFITSVNSHSALSIVKAVCRKKGKRFIALKETGSESLEQTLRAGSA